MRRKVIFEMMAAVLPLLLVSPVYAQQQQTTDGFMGAFAPNQWWLVNRNTDGQSFLREADGNLNQYVLLEDDLIPDVIADDTTLGRAQVVENEADIGLSQPVDLSNDSLFLLGGNQAGEQNCPSSPDSDLCMPGLTALLVTVLEDTLISFRWAYETEDVQPVFDPFGYAISNTGDGGVVIDGQIFPQIISDQFFSQVTDAGPVTQTGVVEVEIKANQVFSFQLKTADNRFGGASVVIDQFQATSIMGPKSVPEPGVAIAILISGLGLQSLRRKS